MHLTDLRPARSYIARHFADHLQDVEADEAIDYVLPLLTELAIDEGAGIIYI